MTQIRRWTAWGAGMALGASVLMTTPAFAASSTTGQSITFEATAYGPSLQDNYPYGAVDYFGQPLTTGDIAVDPTVIPLHSCVRVTGYQSPNLPAGGFIGEADDEGGAIKGKHIDIFMNASASQVSNFGIQSVQVTVLGKATNTSLSGTAACAAYASGSSVPGSQSTSSSGNSISSGSSSGTPSGGNANQGSSNGGQAQSNPGSSSFAADIVKQVRAELGHPFKWGGTSTAGFDSSGLVQWGFAQGGVKLPRLSGQQYQAGTSVSRANLRPGDVVFFRTYKSGPSYDGIYIGAADGYPHAFIAAQNRSKGVTTSNLDNPTWSSRFVGARRITSRDSGGKSSSSSTATNSISPLRQSIVTLALSQLGDPYVFGGTSPSGFDCSGLTQWVYAKNGIQIPRTVKPQMAFGTPIQQSQLRPGDLVFFHTYLPGASHVGIYIGKHGNIAHAFVAADNPSVGVRIDNLDTSKWQGIYVGADSYLP